MSLKTYKDGAWRTVKKWQIRQGNTWQTVKRARTFVGGAWREFYAYVNPITVIFSPTAVTATSSSTVATGGVLAVVSGGTAPITYAWSVASYDAPTTPTIINGATASPTLRQSALGIGDSYTALFMVTATDNLGIVATGQVAATFTRTE
jgi:hypothetical protein